jgi:hypothetical protein
MGRLARSVGKGLPGIVNVFEDAAVAWNMVQGAIREYMLVSATERESLRTAHLTEARKGIVQVERSDVLDVLIPMESTKSTGLTLHNNREALHIVHSTGCLKPLTVTSRAKLQTNLSHAPTSSIPSPLTRY